MRCLHDADRDTGLHDDNDARLWRNDVSRNSQPLLRWEIAFPSCHTIIPARLRQEFAENG